MRAAKSLEGLTAGLSMSLDDITKQRFQHLSNKQLVARINQRFKSGANDDDEVYELFRRSKIQGFKVIPKWDTYEIEE